MKDIKLPSGKKIQKEKKYQKVQFLKKFFILNNCFFISFVNKINLHKIEIPNVF